MNKCCTNNNNYIHLHSFSKSDPFARISIEGGDGKYHEVGRTEVKMNNLNPTWIYPINVDYHPQEKQVIKVELFDEDLQHFKNVVDVTVVAMHDCLGCAIFLLEDLMEAPKKTLTMVS